MKTIPHWFYEADAALKRAAQRAREAAIRANTPLCIWRDGKIVQVPPAELRQEAATREKEVRR